MKTLALAVLAAMTAAPAAAHVGDHSHVPGWHFLLEPAHLLPVLVLAAVVVGGLVWRERRRAAVRARKGES